MKTTKILIPIHHRPEVKSLTTIFFENLLPVLKTKMNVHILWLVYTPEKIDSINNQNDNYTVLDMHKYKNAIDLIKKEKPDLVYAGDNWDFIHYAFTSAAKFLNIPAFYMVASNITAKTSLTGRVFSNISRFFQSSIPTDEVKNKNKLMRRGRFFLFKYLFLLKTKLVMKSEIIQTLFTIWKFVLTGKIDERFANDTVYFLENESLLNERTQLGFDTRNLVVTGSPIYDNFFWKLNEKNHFIKKDEKIHVLFIPSTLYEHGFWTKNQRDYAVKETIRQITKNGKSMSITVKIHPSSSILSDYESLIHSINPSIPVHQKGDILDFLKDSDVVLTFHSSTAEVYALLADKPIVICHYFDLQGDVFLDRNLAINCITPSSLISNIEMALSSNPASEQRRDDFIREFMFKWDGHAGERISNEIVKLIEKSHSVK